MDNCRVGEKWMELGSRIGKEDWEGGLGRRIGKEVGIRSWVRSWTPREIERKRRVVNICEGLMRGAARD